MSSQEPDLAATLITLAVLKSSGGPTKTIASFQKALGASQYCFCTRDELKNNALAIPNAKAVYATRFPVLKQLRYIRGGEDREAREAVRKSRIVSCHSFYRYHIEWMNRMHEQYRTPYWFVPHGILDPWVIHRARLGKTLFWKYIGRKFVDNASAVICSTTAEKEKALSQMELPNCEVLPWPVDEIDCSNRAVVREEIRRDLSIPLDAKVLLYFGRLHSMKRPLDTIKAIALGSKQVHLMIVGNEQDVSLSDCYQAAKDCGIEKRVHLVGPVYGEKKYDYVLAADAYISMSHRENFNHTAAESLSAGLPLILSPGNDLGGEIREENCSWRLADDEVKTASSAIEAFEAIPSADLQDMGVRGQNWVSDNLSFSTFSSRLQAMAKTYGKSK